MKKGLFMILAVFMTAGILQAQEKQQIQKQDSTQEYFICRNGQMFQVKDEQWIPLQGQCRLNNGAAVNPDGTYQLRNGKSLRLRDGQCVNFDGKRFRSETQCLRRMESGRNQNQNKAKGMQKNNRGQRKGRG